MRSVSIRHAFENRARGGQHEIGARGTEPDDDDSGARGRHYRCSSGTGISPGGSSIRTSRWFAGFGRGGRGHLILLCGFVEAPRAVSGIDTHVQRFVARIERLADCLLALGLGRLLRLVVEELDDLVTEFLERRRPLVHDEEVRSLLARDRPDHFAEGRGLGRGTELLTEGLRVETTERAAGAGLRIDRVGIGEFGEVGAGRELRGEVGRGRFIGNHDVRDFLVRRARGDLFGVLLVEGPGLVFGRQTAHHRRLPRRSHR